MAESRWFCFTRRRIATHLSAFAVGITIIIVSGKGVSFDGASVGSRGFLRKYISQFMKPNVKKAASIDCTKHKYIFIPGRDGGRLAHSMVLTYRLLVFSEELESAKKRTQQSTSKHIPVIPDVKMESLRSTFDFNVEDWTIGNDTATEDCIKNSEWTRVKYVSWRTTKNASSLFTKQILLDPWPVTDFGIKGNEKRFRKLFRVKQQLLDEARNVIASAKAQVGLQKNASQISVHLRRKDYVTFMEESFSTPYYTPAFINHLIWNVSQASTTSLILVLSDDIEWCKENIKKLPNLVFLSTGSAPLDFAVLTNSNISVVAFGGFGFLAALLAGGEIIRVAPSPRHLRYQVSSEEHLPNVRYAYYLNGTDAPRIDFAEI